MRVRHLLPPALLLASLTGCDRSPHGPDATPGQPVPGGTAAAVAPDGGLSPAPTSPPAASPVPRLPGLTFGQAIPAGSGWLKEKDQISDGCLIWVAPDRPDSYAIAIDGRLARVTFGRGSGFRLPGRPGSPGITPGATEAAVRAAYPDLVAEPHKYMEPPAKYLTSPQLAADQAGLRFEIDADGTVALIHLGLPAALGLVEGCA